MENTHPEKDYLLSVLAENHAGVLLRISGLFSRRCYNIKSIVAAQTADASRSEILIVVTGDDRIVKQVKRQLEKLVDIVSVTVLDRETSVVREHILLKVAGSHCQHLPCRCAVRHGHLHAGGTDRRSPDAGLLRGAVPPLWHPENSPHRLHGRTGINRLNCKEYRKGKCRYADSR